MTTKPTIVPATSLPENMNTTEPIAIAKPGDAADPFNPKNLRVNQSFIDSAGVKKLLTTVPVHKPKKQDFIRVHPEADYRADPIAIIELEEDRETYLVTPNTATDLQNELRCVTLFTAMNRQGVVFLWPVKIGAGDARILEWYRSAREAAEMAMERWVRVQANTSLGAYEITPAGGTIPDPEWPTESFPELLRIAFRDRFIDRLDHPVVRHCAVSSTYEHVIAADFEFNFGGHASTEEAARSGERPRPVCMVARDLCTGQEWRIFQGDFGPVPPFPIGTDAVFVAYYASAELGCFHALGWPKPANIIDLFVEFRDRTNHIAQRRKPGVKPPGARLIDALTYFGLDTIGAIEKDEMRALVLRGGPSSEAQ
jgi:hypothetical protein